MTKLLGLFYKDVIVFIHKLGLKSFLILHLP